METNAELLARINAAVDVATSTKAIVTKIGTETAAALVTISELRAALERQGMVSPEVSAAMGALETQLGGIQAEAESVDKQVPDA